MIETPITKATIKQYEEMDAHNKVTLIKFKKRAWVIYYNGCIAGVEYECEENQENKNEDYS